MNHSIDLMDGIEQNSGGRLNMNRRGYLYATCNDQHAEELLNSAEQSGLFGSGPTRVHNETSIKSCYHPSPDEGIDYELNGAIYSFP
jgi:hypothetical protein